MVREIVGRILSASVRNVYHLKDGSTVLKLAAEESSYELRIIPGSCMYVTEEAIPKPGEPTKYAQSLRRYVNSSRVRGFSQLGTERIVEVELETRIGRVVKLYAELFPPGNVVLIDENNVVITCLREVESKSRTVKTGATYSLPPSRFSYTPGGLQEDWLNMLRRDSPVVAALSRDLGLGGKYAEELLHRAGVEKGKKVKELDEHEQRMLVDALNEIDAEMRNPRFLIYIRDGEVIPSIIRLRKLEESGYRWVEVQEFNEAIKLSYEYQERMRHFEEARKPIEEEMHRLRKTIAEKEYVIQQISEKAKQLEEKINSLSQNAEVVESIRLTALQGEGSKSYGDVNLVEVNERERKFTVDIRGFALNLALDTSTWRQLGSMYDELKTIRNTINKLQGERSSLLTKLRELEDRLTRIRPDIHAAVQERVSLTVEGGFKRIRRFITSEGLEVVAGKDASSNIALIRRHMNHDDLVFHAEIRGSPVAILKQGLKAGEASIEETAQFTACYSRAWREGLSSATVYYVKTEQVSLSPPPGQFLPKGSFMVYGRRNYLTAELTLAVSIERHERRVRAVTIPKLTAEKLGIRYVEIKPGNLNAAEAAKRIIEFFKLDIPKEVEEKLTNVLASMIPYGRCHVIMKEKNILN